MPHINFVFVLLCCSLFCIIKSISIEIANIIIPSKYILNVNPNVSAERPTKAGPNITPVKAMLDT